MQALQTQPVNVQAIRREVEEALKSILGKLSKGMESQEEEALWAIRKAVEGMGVKKGFESFYRLNMDGFLVGYGSNEGYEEEDAKIEAFNFGFCQGMKAV